MKEQKYYYVPWQSSNDGLNCLSLQGPHTHKDATRIANEIRSSGFMASIIDCTNSLRVRSDVKSALEMALTNLKYHSVENHFAIQEIERVLKLVQS